MASEHWIWRLSKNDFLWELLESGLLNNLKRTSDQTCACGQPAAGKSEKCAECLAVKRIAYDAGRKKKVYKGKVDMGICLDCAQPVISIRRLCVKCNDRRNLAARNRRQRAHYERTKDARRNSVLPKS